MPDPSSSEATAIEVAYEDQVKALFKVLVANLVEEPVTTRPIGSVSTSSRQISSLRSGQGN
jgi:hypothetical protein